MRQDLPVNLILPEKMHYGACILVRGFSGRACSMLLIGATGTRWGGRVSRKDETVLRAFDATHGWKASLCVCAVPLIVANNRAGAEGAHGLWK